MNYNPLDEKPKIRFGVLDWITMSFCIFGVLYVLAQIVRMIIT